MKSLKILLSVLVFCIGHCYANAQFMKSSSSSINMSSSNEGYNSILFGYAPTSLTDYADKVEAIEKGKNETLFLGFTHISPIKDTPAMVEFGGVLEYTKNSFQYIDYPEDKDILSFWGIKFPVNILIPISVGNSFSIAPYAGLNAKCFLIAKAEFYEDGEKVNTENLYSLSKDLWDGDDIDCKRFTAGFQIGAKVLLDRLILSLGYSSDISNLYHWNWDPDDDLFIDSKFDKMLSIGIGIKF